jgi:hypothetical protein
LNLHDRFGERCARLGRPEVTAASDLGRHHYRRRRRQLDGALPLRLVVLNVDGPARKERSGWDRAVFVYGGNTPVTWAHKTTISRALHRRGNSGDSAWLRWPATRKAAFGQADCRDAALICSQTVPGRHSPGEPIRVWRAVIERPTGGPHTATIFRFKNKPEKMFFRVRKNGKWGKI